MKKLEFWIESTFNDYNKKKTVSVCGKFKTRKLLIEQSAYETDLKGKKNLK